MTPKQIADRYYAAFREGTDWNDIPMAESLCFRSPRMSLEGPEAFRGALRGLQTRVKGLDIRRQLADGDTVVTVYDFDLGAPSGPIAMSEVLEVKGGEITDMELIFDPAPLSASGG